MALGGNNILVTYVSSTSARIDIRPRNKSRNSFSQDADNINRSIIGVEGGQTLSPVKWQPFSILVTTLSVLVIIPDLLKPTFVLSTKRNYETIMIFQITLRND